MKALVGTRTLVRLILRLDRVSLPIWVVLIALSAAGIVSSYAQLYSTAASLKAYADEIAGSPAETAMLGPVFASTLGGLTAWRWSMAGSILIGLANLLVVIRHTRTDEEAGRRELLESTVVGRQAPLLASLLVVGVADLVLAALTVVGLVGMGLPVAGSVALSLSVAAFGWFIAATTAVAAQLTQSPGAARGIVGAVLGLAYALRVVGDGAGVPWLNWLSPLGWVRLTRPYAGEQWWVFTLFLAGVAVLAAVAFRLSARRDLGAGLLPPRVGPAVAGPGLRGPLTLAWRLQRGSLFAWAAAAFVTGGLIGIVAKTVTDQLAASPQLFAFFTQGGQTQYGEVFIAIVLMALGGEVTAVYAITSTLQLRSAETGGKAELVLATPVSRWRWMASYLAMAVLGSAVIVGLFGVAAGLTYGLSVGDVGRELPRVVVAALAYWPALWVLAGVAAATYGLLPRFAGWLTWGFLVLCVILELGGELGQVSQSTLDVSPFAHVPRVLLGTGSATSLVGLVAVAAVLTALGLAGFRRRDLA